MIKALTVYFISQAAVLFWFYSPFKLSLYKFITKKETFSHDEVDLFLLTKSSLLKILTCTFCFSFWTSIFVALFLSEDLVSFLRNFSLSLVLLFLYEQIINFLKRVD